MDWIAKKTPMIEKARTCEELFAQMEHERRLYELREKGLHDLASLQKHARREGREEGREEGRKEGLTEGLEKGLTEGLEKGRTEALRSAARNMLCKGMAPALVAEVTGLPLDEVRTLGD